MTGGRAGSTDGDGVCADLNAMAGGGGRAALAREAP
jgi:hypothetical protein